MRRGTRTRAASSFLCAAVVLLTVAGCGSGRPQDAYLLAVEPSFWYAATDAYPDLEEMVRDTVLGDGRRLRVALVDSEQPLEVLRELLADGRYAGVVLPPLLSLQAAELAAAHPQMRFVALTWTEDAATMAGNVTSVSFERTAAFERSGRLLAAYLDRHPDARVGVLATSGPIESANRVAFRDGLAAAGASNRLIERTLNRPEDSSDLKRSLDALQRADVQVVYLEVGALTGAALESLAADSRLAIVRNWGTRAGFAETVLVSVNDHPLTAIVAGIDAAPGAGVSVPAEVVWGSAAPPPAGSAELYDRVRRTAPDGGRSPTATDP